MSKTAMHVGIALFAAATLSAKALVFGVVPQQSPTELAATWKPIIAYLETATGETVHLKVERSIPDFERSLYAGRYDIAYMNPYHYIVAHKRQGYLARVRDKKPLVGILVVRQDSGITNLSMMRGKTFLFPAPDAFAATLLTKYELLKQAGIDVDRDQKFRYVNSHDSVYKGVARGIGDVGGGIERTFNTLDDPDAKASLTIRHKTAPYPSHPFAFHPALSATVQEKMSDALLHLPPTLLAPLRMQQIVPTDDREYNGVRDIADALPSLQDY